VLEGRRWPVQVYHGTGFLSFFSTAERFLARMHKLGGDSRGWCPAEGTLKTLQQLVPFAFFVAQQSY